MTFDFTNLTPRQQQMIVNPARVLWVGAGTKTGKSAAAHASSADEVISGGSVCWIGPWSEQSFISYMAIKRILQPLIDAGEIKANDSTMRMFARNGGTFTTKTGDNPEAIFGGGYDLVVIDEASRQTEVSYHAARTTVSATKGRIKLMFNLDHGAANWAVRNLLRVKSATDEERAASGEDFMIFPTGGEGLVSDEEIEQVRRSGMPAPIFNALYHAEIPDTDLSLFHNLAEIFAGGPQPEGPEQAHYYVAGMDVARKQNWTAITIFDCTVRKVVAMQRFHEISWTLQYAKAKALYDFWKCGKLIVDASGLGDPVEEELYKIGINVQGYIFTEKSRTALIEQLVVACDGKQFRVCNAPEFDVLRTELEVFQVLLDPKTGRVRYGVSAGQHDDTAFALMLAWHNYLSGGHGPTDFKRTLDADEVAARDWGAF